MNKKECKQALDIYKKFLIRMEKVGEFLKTAEVSFTPKIHLLIAFPDLSSLSEGSGAQRRLQLHFLRT